MEATFEPQVSWAEAALSHWRFQLETQNCSKPGDKTMARVLIIDDETNIRVMIKLALRGAGHSVGMASDGREGLETFQDGVRWDLVLLDQRMPGMEGIEVLRE